MTRDDFDTIGLHLVRVSFSGRNERSGTDAALQLGGLRMPARAAA